MKRWHIFIPLKGARDSWHISSSGKGSEKVEHFHSWKGVLIGALDSWYISSLLKGVLKRVIKGVSLERGGFKT